MNMQSIFICWQKSLDSFKKDSFNLFLLGTLATAIRSIKTMTKLFWWLLAATWAIQSILAQHQELKLFSVLILIVHIPLIYIMLLTIRPSLEAKDYRYYYKYLPGIIALVGLRLIFSKALLMLIGIFPLLFFFDSETSFSSFFRSIERGIKALIYFFPGFIVTAVFFVLINAALVELASLITHVWPTWLIYAIFFVLEDMILLLNLSAFAVYYLKLKHEHFDLLFS